MQISTGLMFQEQTTMRFVIAYLEAHGLIYRQQAAYKVFMVFNAIQLMSGKCGHFALVVIVVILQSEHLPPLHVQLLVTHRAVQQKQLLERTMLT